MQEQKSLTLHWRSFLGDSSDVEASIFGVKGGHYFDYVWQQPCLLLSIRLTRQKFGDTSFVLMSRMGQQACLYPFYL